MLAGLRFQESNEGDRHAYKDFAVIFATAEHRDIAERALSGAGVQTKRYFLPIHHMSAYTVHAKARLPVTDEVANQVLCLPIFDEMTVEQVKRVSNIVRESLGDQWSASIPEAHCSRAAGEGTPHGLVES